MTKIRIFGDRITDYHLVESPKLPSMHHQDLPCLIQTTTSGGADYLGRLLNGLVKDTSVEVYDASQAQIDVYNIWKSFPKEKGEKDAVFRIDRLLGRTKCECKKDSKVNLSSLGKNDLAVVDSLGIGWLEGDGKTNSSGQLAALCKARHVVLKLSSLTGGFPLADFLKKNSVARQKLTVIISVLNLRERGAAISRGLSWDRTIEETLRELHEGLSSRDLALCKRVAVLFGAEGVAVFDRENGDKVRLNRFVYHPSECEGSHKERHPGKMYGNLSILTTALVCHLAASEGNAYPLYAALCLALAAMRKQQETGIPLNKDARGLVQAKSLESVEEVQKILRAPFDFKGMPEKTEEEIAAKQKFLKENLSPLSTFASSFRHDTLDNKPLNHQEGRSNLLADATGYSARYIAAKALDVVMRGVDNTLESAPKVRYGKFCSVDREEIERVNAVRNLIEHYLKDRTDGKPLSLAVFGPPGSGKSFAIKQLAKQLRFNDADMIEFNLSQFRTESHEQLHEAFHMVRDATVRGRIPLVFWDEFDSADHRWVKEFLAPMQDAQFTSGSITHPFGKAIFIFAGGVSHSFADFNRYTEKSDKEPTSEEKTAIDKGRACKIPDFISRLRGYVNIKGPNPVTDGDTEYLIRRACLLRAQLESSTPRIKGEGGILAISPALVQAFLRVKKYLHGARSMEALIRMSDTMEAIFYGEAALPPEEQMALHVDVADFKRILKEETLGAAMIEVIAAACHQGWLLQKEADGYKYDDIRRDVGPRKTHQLMKPYSELDEEGKEGNRCTARLTMAKFAEVGLEIIQGDGKARGVKIDDATRDKLYRIEHDIWLRDKLLKGVDFAEITNDNMRLHRCVQQFDNLTYEDRKLDQAIVDAVIEELKEQGYIFVKKRGE